MYTILFGGLLISIFAIMYGFDKSLIWRQDGLTQHYLILYDFNELVRNWLAHPQNGFPDFSFNMGLGQDIIGQYSYYVIGDPFAYLSLLFPMEHLELVYILLIFLRMYFVGIAFIAFAKYMKLNPGNIVIGALIYTFSGFVLYAGTRHPYFLNAVILFPFLLIGIEKLLKEGKIVFLTVVAFLSLIVNYYFFYMLTMLALIYGLVKFFFEYRHLGAKYFFRSLLKGIGGYFIAIPLAAVIFLPTLYTFFHSSRVGISEIASYPFVYYCNFLNGLVTTDSSRWNIYGVSSIILLMLPLLLKNIKQHKTVFTYTLIMFIIILVPALGSFMNGFSFPNNRWIFAFSFMLAYIVTLFLDLDFAYSNKDKKLMILSLGGYLILVAVANKKVEHELLIMIALSVAMFLVILLNREISRIPKVKPSVLLVILILVNFYMLGNYLYGLDGTKQYAKEFTRYGAAEEAYQSMQGRIAHLDDAVQIVKKDKGFYRTVNYPCSIHNTSLYFNQMGICSFLSLGSKYESQISRDLENREYAVSRNLKEFDNRTKITTVLGVKYYILDEKHQNMAPYGFSPYKTIKDKKKSKYTNIYKNDYNLGLSAFYDTYITEAEYRNLSPLEKEDSLLNQAAIAEKPAACNITKSAGGKAVENKVNYNVSDPDKILHAKNRIITTKKEQSIRLNVKDIKNSELYVSIKNIKYHPFTEKELSGIAKEKEYSRLEEAELLKKSKDKALQSSSSGEFKITASTNLAQKGEYELDQKSDPYYFDNDTFLINLGYMENYSGKVDIQFEKKGTYTFSDMDIIAIDMKQYEKDISKRIQDNMKITNYGTDFVEGKISNKKDGILQLSTPFSVGWRVSVDGKEVETINVNTAFVGVPLKAGSHKVEFTYTTPYRKTGILLSLVGLACFISLVVLERKGKHRNNA